MTAREKLVGLVLMVMCPVLIIGGWWWWTTTNDSFYFPPLPDIVAAFRDDWVFERVGSDLAATMRRFLIGYNLAVVLGVGVGLALGLFRGAARTVWPVVEFMRALPPPALLPFTIVAIGIDDRAKVFLIVLGSIWPILLNTIDGIRGVDSTLLESARSYGAGRGALLRTVQIPAALPQVMAGMRSSLSIALILTVISELVATSEGVGFSILQSQRNFQIDSMWAGMLMLGLVGVGMNALFTQVERRILHWYHVRAELQRNT